MKSNVIETVMGAVVLLVAAGFVTFAYKATRLDTNSGYILRAVFDRVDGLTIGSDVRVSGLKVGAVINQKIDTKTYQAIIEFSVKDSVKLPKDTSAEIVSDGLLGNKYIALVPGADDAMLNNGELVRFTQPSISIEQLIGKFVFGAAGDKDKEKSASNSSSNDSGNKPISLFEPLEGPATK